MDYNIVWIHNFKTGVSYFLQGVGGKGPQPLLQAGSHSTHVKDNKWHI